MPRYGIASWVLEFQSAVEDVEVELVGEGATRLEAEVHILVGRALQGRNDVYPRTQGLELCSARRAFGELLARSGADGTEAATWLRAVLAANKEHEFHELLHHAVMHANDDCVAPPAIPGKLIPSQALLALCDAAESKYASLELMEAQNRGTALVCYQVRAMCTHEVSRNAIDSSERLQLHIETA